MIFSRDTGFGPESGYGDVGLNRLNARCQVFMEPFRTDFEGAKVLDLASHDGRWSYASLMLGADHVTGIEARPEAISRGRHLFETEKFRGRAEFIPGDIFDVLSGGRLAAGSFDVVLCLGVFYHVMDHFRLLKLIRNLDPSLIILDTSLIDDQRPFITLETERTDHMLNAIADNGVEDAVIGIVSKGALELMARNLSLDVTYLEWVASRFESLEGLHDYFEGGAGERRRFSAVLRPSEGRK